WLLLSLLAVSDRKLHDRAIVIDAHSDCTQRITYDGIDFSREQPDMHVDLPKMKAGGLDAQFFSIFVGPWPSKPDTFYPEPPRALANVPRNMTDAMLKAVARNGGAVCVNYGAGFLDEDFFKAEQAIWARTRALGLGPKELFRTVRDEAARLPPVPLSKLIDHIDHMARVAGV